ncbi:peptidase C39 family protein [Nocardioides anomalus]|uniref:Peptidase C39 family protein n=1 Tax=Nocardioides anomalus TaxID=2712223 RepID=A0A6G6WL64_9ACTN|nr:peptidase C39 family protein [Nocardioides anomalus]
MTAACSLALAAGMLASVPVSAAPAPADRLVSFTRLPLIGGERTGLRLRDGALVLKDGAQRSRAYRGTRYSVGTWTSDPVAPGFGFTQLVASWSATTPRNSWVEVRVRVTGATTGRWLVLGRWASQDKHVRRTSLPGQSDALGRVDVDTWKSATGASSYQLQLRLMRRAGARSASPSVSYAGAVASQLPASAPATSAPGVARGVVLDVPRFSQMVHSGEFPQFGGGGEAWCSPTSTAMVLGYYGRLPAASAYAWAGPRTEPWVDEVARRTYDAAYEGTGNWPFNTAYAASRGLDAFVTRLRSLAEAETLVAAGIPVIISVSFSSGALAGAPISSTAGHLLVVVGFDATGNPVVNDPAASTSAGVRRTYDRGQLERAWLEGSGGTAYVLHDAAHPLPASPGNW